MKPCPRPLIANFTLAIFSYITFIISFLDDLRLTRYAYIPVISFRDAFPIPGADKSFMYRDKEISSALELLSQSQVLRSAFWSRLPSFIVYLIRIYPFWMNDEARDQVEHILLLVHRERDFVCGLVSNMNEHKQRGQMNVVVVIHVDCTQ